MQQVLFQHEDFTAIDARAGRDMPGHGTGVRQAAANDDCYDSASRGSGMILPVLGNVIGGALLLSGLVLLPYLAAAMLG